MATKKTSRTASKTAKAKTSRSSARSSSNAAARRRPIWSGNLRLALVSVPVNVFPATSSGAHISFHQVHEPSGKRIRYEKIVPGLGPVDTDEIVKGYDLGGGDYVLIDPDELDELKLEAKKTLDLVQFVDQCEIDPIWYDRPYYVVADGDLAEEAYVVLREALRASGRTAIGQFIMRGREHVAAIKPCGQGLMLETLRFADEVREAAPYFTSTSEEKPDKELLDLATELIERKSGAFDPDDFEDSYTEAVRALIESRSKNRKPVKIDEDEGDGGGAQIIDLVDALKKSVNSSKGRKSRSSSGSRKKAS